MPCFTQTEYSGLDEQRSPQVQALEHPSPVGGTFGKVLESLGGSVLLEKHITVSGL